MTYQHNYFVFQAVLLWFVLFQNLNATPQPSLVKDINTTPSAVSSVPRYIVNMNGINYFIASDGSNGHKLWRSDGTEGGTTFVKDVWSASRSSEPWFLTNVNNTLFFSASDSKHGTELWKSDGTAAGTTLVKDISEGSGSSNPEYLTNVDGTLFFFSKLSKAWVSDYELWKSDGTAVGTTLITTVSGVGDRNFINLNGMLFFVADDGIHGEELWKSDGTAAGTTQVKDILPGINGSGSNWLREINDTLFFSANDGVNGHELWQSDGTAVGTKLVKDVLADGSSTPRYLTNVNGTLFFTAFNFINGRELWKSDGTSDGTILVKGVDDSSWIESLINVNGTLFFSIYNELWKSDGTLTGTSFIKDYGSKIFNFASVDNTLFFNTNDGTHGYELWQSDGSVEGTTFVKDIRIGSGSSWPNNMISNGTFNTSVTFNNITTGQGNSSREKSLMATTLNVANDKFIDSIPLIQSSGSTIGTNINATKENGEPNHSDNTGGKSVWWNWTAPSLGKVTFDTEGSNFDTLIGSYISSSGSSLTPIMSNDDANGGLQSQITFDVQSGTTYYIAVDGFSATSGQIMLNWSFAQNISAPLPLTVTPNENFVINGIPGGPYTPGLKTYTLTNFNTVSKSFQVSGLPSWLIASETSGTLAAGESIDITLSVNSNANSLNPGVHNAGILFNSTTRLAQITISSSIQANDLFANAQLISGLPLSTTGTNVDTNKETGEPNHANNIGGKSVWWRWIAPSSGFISVDTFGSNFDTLLGIYIGNQVNNLTAIAINDDAVNAQSQVVTKVNAGNTYYIAIDGYNGASGSIILNITPSSSTGTPNNDDFGNATIITGIPNILSGTNTSATKQVGEVNHANNIGGKSVWWVWSSPVSQEVSIDTFGSNFDTLLGIYTGNQVNSLATIGSNDDATSFSTQSAVTFTPTKGVTYYIGVDGYSGDSGNITLNIFSTEPVNFPLQVTTIGNGTVINDVSGINCPTKCGESYPSGTSLLLAAIADDRWVFSGWSGDCTGTGVCSLTMLVERNVTATFTSTPLLSVFKTGNGSGFVSSSPSGISCGSDCLNTYTVDTSVNLTATPIQGSIFLGWTGGSCTGTQVCSIDLNIDTSVAASFALIDNDSDVIPDIQDPDDDNDLFSNAKIISGLPISTTGTNLNASKETGEPNHGNNTGGKSVWWRWTASSNSSISVDTFGSNFDTTLGIYIGNQVNNLTTLATNDDANGGLQSQITFDVQSGTTYYIAVDGFSATSGQIMLNWSFAQNISAPLPLTVTPNENFVINGIPGGPYTPGLKTYTLTNFNTVSKSFQVSSLPSWLIASETSGTLAAGESIDITLSVNSNANSLNPGVHNAGILFNSTTRLAQITISSSIQANDLFANAQLISGLPLSTTGTNVDTNKETGEPNHANNIGGKSVWWRWIAPSSGFISVDTFGSNFDTLLGIYIGNQVNNLTAIAINDDAVNAQSQVVTKVNAGNTYYIAIDGYNGASGSIILNITPSSSTGTPNNDDFGNATIITGIPNILSGTNTSATKQVGEVNHANNIGGKSVWWVWSSPVSQEVSIDTFGSNFDTLLGIYTGNQVNSLATIGSNDDATSFSTQSAVTFTPTKGVTYYIGVDGYSGDSGNITLNIFSTEPVNFPLQVTTIGNGTVINDVSGINCPTKCGESYPSGTSLLLAAIADDRWVFSGWSGDCTGTGVCSLTMLVERNVTATFTSTPLLSAFKTMPIRLPPSIYKQHHL